MSVHYRRTDAGREAIRDRGSALSRPARNLLLVIDESRSGDDWVGLVAGATPADLSLLVQSGYVAALGAAAPLQTALAGPVALQAAIERLSYRDLYDRLTSEARKRLGLIKGYRTVLEIEKCSGADEIRRLALRFIADVRVAQGDDAALQACRSLGLDI